MSSKILQFLPPLLLLLLLLILLPFSPVSPFIAIAEFIHLFSFIILFLLFLKNSGWKGISYKTQILFIITTFSRYSHIFHHASSTLFVMILKVVYMVIAIIVGILLITYLHTYERHNDSASIVLLLICCIGISTVNFSLTTQWSGVFGYLWLFSQYVQAFALIPQFIFCYRCHSDISNLLFVYILSIGGYRIFYGIYWLQLFFTSGRFYFAGPLALMLCIPFLVDFIIFKIYGKLTLSSSILTIDKMISDIRYKFSIKSRNIMDGRTNLISYNPVHLNTNFEVDEEQHSVFTASWINGGDTQHHPVDIEVGGDTDK